MTDLEERVRDALRARAGEFTASPDAWERTTARAGRRAARRLPRRPARQRWVTRFIPLAAAAAVLVIGAGSATLAQSGGFSGALRHIGLEPSRTQAPQGTPSPSGGEGRLPTPVCDVPGLPGNTHVVGVPISAKVTRDGVTTWWTRVPGSVFRQTGTNLVLCQYVPDGATPAPGGLGLLPGAGTPEAPLGQGELVRARPLVIGFSNYDSDSGIAAASVTSVEADLANGNVVRGDVAYGPGFPYAAWWLNYPQGIAATVVFRDAAGRVVKEIAEPYPSAFALKHPDPIPLFSGVPALSRPCEQARVQQVMNGVKVWTYVGFLDPHPVAPTKAAPTLCEVTGTVAARASYSGTYTMPAGQVARAFFVLYPTSSVSGIAARGVTSVTAVLADGRKYTGTLVTGKLFAYPVWLVSYPLKDPATLVFRNAAGEQAAVLHEPANP